MAWLLGVSVANHISKSWTMKLNKLKHEMKSTGRIRVIIQDNGPIHKSLDVQQKLPQWESQACIFSFYQNTAQK